MALLKSLIDGDSQQVFSTALQVAAHEAKRGHPRVAKQLRDLVDRGRAKDSAVSLSAGTIMLARPRGDLAQLLTIDYPQARLTSMILSSSSEARLERVILEQTQSQKLLAHGLAPRRKLLLAGAPGTGKTMTASALAGELRLPLFTIRLEGVITKFMGETAQKLRTVFDAIARTRGIYLFDEFDAFGAKRTSGNDVGEIRRILNSFLQLLEQDKSQSLIVAATNHPELLDRALFRRFDDVMQYGLPARNEICNFIRSRLRRFKTNVDWELIAGDAEGFSQADLVRCGDEIAKSAVLKDEKIISTEDVLCALEERRIQVRQHPVE
jgi:SpoVK/Ycf46/Vps4 family AAA+-type ATPase